MINIIHTRTYTHAHEQNLREVRTVSYFACSTQRTTTQSNITSKLQRHQHTDITSYEFQYHEIMMHFSFNLLSIKGLYMFQALLAHPQEVLILYTPNIGTKFRLC
jgi:hypothetical protein